MAVIKHRKTRTADMVVRKSWRRFPFAILNGIISSLLGMLIYFAFLRNMEISLQKWLLVFLDILITGWIGTKIARKASKYYFKDKRKVKNGLRNFYINVAYALIITIGGLKWLFEIDNIMYIFLIWLFIKAFLYYYFDNVADGQLGYQ